MNGMLTDTLAHEHIAELQREGAAFRLAAEVPGREGPSMADRAAGVLRAIAAAVPTRRHRTARV